MLIGHIITAVAKDEATQIQLALEILHHHSKTIFNHLYKYRITSWYDNAPRFKKSAAANFSKGDYLNGVQTNNTIFQVISDNCDTGISSQKGKSQTYCLATILAKTSNLRKDLPHTTFRQLKKEEITISTNDACVAELLVYDGLKKTEIVNPEINLPTDVFKMQKISSARSQETGFNFFLGIAYKSKCLECNGYCYRLSNDQGLGIGQKTKIIYMPHLITSWYQQIQTPCKHL